MIEFEVNGETFKADLFLLPFLTESLEEYSRKLYEKGIALFTEDKDQEAKDLLEQSISLDPKYTEAIESLGVLEGKTWSL